MAVDLTITYALGTAGMALGTIALAVGLRGMARTHPARYAALVGVTGIATVAYALMTAGIGTVTVGERVVFLPRYVDWLLTTPPCSGNSATWSASSGSCTPSSG